jgi:hypothetical protein
MYRFIKQKIKKNFTSKEIKAFNVEVPKDVDNEIIRALRGLNLTEEEIQYSLRSSMLSNRN